MNGFFVEQMAMYAAYHGDPRNRALHFIGVPMIAFALLVPMALVKFAWIGAYPVSIATLFGAAVMTYWIVLDWRIGGTTAIVTLPLLALAAWVSTMGAAAALTVFGVSFVGGWIIQLIGHGIEGRKPALLDNLLQIFIAPTFLTAEAGFTLGWWKRVEKAVEARRPAYAAADALASGTS